MNINFNILFKLITPLLFLFVVSYFINTVVFSNLPKSGVEFVSKNIDEVPYLMYDLHKSFNSVKKVKTISSRVLEKKEYQLLSNLTLNAVYSKSDATGWAIIKENSSSETHILKNGELFKNYTLKQLFPSFVIFERDKKEYKLAMKQTNKKIEVITQKSDDNKWNEKIVFEGDKVSIKRNFLNSYVNDLEKVWRDVKIDEVKKNGIIIGFKVSQISRGSIFESLGLKKDDVITKINNIRLNNYNKAFGIYKNIKNIKYLNIEVLRNNRQLELNYEIN